MADFVRVPETDWQNILDATREKTGSTERMLSGEVATAIAGIEIGGGGGGLSIADIIEENLPTSIDYTGQAIPAYRFYGWNTLTEVEFTTTKTQKDISCGSYAFSNCKALKKISFPTSKKVDTYVFVGCSALEDVDMPALEEYSMYMFRDCTALKKIDLPAITKINNAAFSGCKNLTTLVLRSNSLLSIGSTNVFQNTPFYTGGTGGTVYVPQALVEQYQQATNWSVLYAAGTCNFVAIEGSEYE